MQASVGRFPLFSTEPRALASGFRKRKTGPGAFAPPGPLKATGWLEVEARLEFEHAVSRVAGVIQVPVGRRGLAEGRTAGAHRAELEVGDVEDVESADAELEIHMLLDLHPLEQHHVKVSLPRAIEIDPVAERVRSQLRPDVRRALIQVGPGQSARLERRLAVGDEALRQEPHLPDTGRRRGLVNRNLALQLLLGHVLEHNPAIGLIHPITPGDQRGWRAGMRTPYRVQFPAFDDLLDHTVAGRKEMPDRKS